jgi:arylsulfatase A-like enzyme
MQPQRAPVKDPFAASAAFGCGARSGAGAFFVYWIIECWMCSVLPWFLSPHYEYRPVHRGFTVLLLFLYPVMGAVAGGVCGSALWRLNKQGRDRSFLEQTSGAAALLLTFNGALAITFPASLWMALAAALSTPLFFMLLWLNGGKRRRGFRLLAGPWAIALILLGSEYVTADYLAGTSVVVKFSGLVATLTAISLVVWFAHSLAGTWSNRIRGGPLILAAMVVLACSLLFDQEPLEQGKTAAAQPGTHANVILIVMDTVRADHLSIYGYGRDTSPNLRQLAGTATLYTRAIASGDMTLSTHASLFTGKYPSSHGAHYLMGRADYPRLPENSQTLAELLAGNGYATMGVVANYAFLGHNYGLDRGFHYYDQRVAVPFAAGVQPFYLRSLVQQVIALFYSTPVYERVARSGDEVNRDLFPMLDRARGGGHPLFLFVNYMDAHTPYVPPAPFDDLFPGRQLRFKLARVDQLKSDVNAFQRRIPPADLAHIVSQYDGGIAYMDAQIGGLISRLKQAGLYDNTMLIITSDHGEMFGEKNLLGHEIAVYQGLVHVPLIIKYPHQNKAATVDELVSSIDIMPTILDQLSYPIPKWVQGRSVLRPAAPDSIAVFSESFATPFLSQSYPRFHRVERAVFSDRVKYIQSTAGKRELYDLATDRDEDHNLFDGGARSQAMVGKLDTWQRAVQREPVQQKAPDRKGLERLRNLGYIK